jgi:hypothetical protein
MAQHDGEIGTLLAPHFGFTQRLGLQQLREKSVTLRPLAAVEEDRVDQPSREFEQHEGSFLSAEGNEENKPPTRTINSIPVAGSSTQ